MRRSRRSESAISPAVANRLASAVAASTRVSACSGTSALAEVRNSPIRTRSDGGANARAKEVDEIARPPSDADPGFLEGSDLLDGGAGGAGEKRSRGTPPGPGGR